MTKRIIALLLALILTVGLLPTVALAAKGDEKTTANPITNPKSQTANRVTLSKTAAKNDDGTYTIRLEAYAHGSSTTTETTEEVPTDIILVLDRSGSMSRDMGKIEYKEYTRKARRNGNLYEKRENVFFSTGEDTYVPVTITQSETTVYTPFDAEWTSNSRYYDYRNNLYAKVGDDYKKVNVS
ncbi:MAG: hypothetical protein MR697_07630, partial [Clostridiales bacterium]|nr:hypothetical protein [Clostridiales bacterium]